MSHRHSWLNPYTNTCGVCGLTKSEARTSAAYQAGLATANDEVRDAAIALEAMLFLWIDRHYTMEYPFQKAWLALHRALYGHERKPALDRCELCTLAQAHR